MSIALQILLNDEEIDGKKTVYVANRDIRCEYVPRHKVSTFKSDYVAVYLLIGSDEEQGDLIYVGETEEGSTRLLNHDKKKEFWDYAYFFFSNTHNLNKADVKFLEARIYQAIKEAGRYKLENATIPKESHVHDIRQSELMDMFKTIEFILGGAFNLFPFKKVDLQLEVNETKEKINHLKQQLDELEKETFYMTQKGADAKGYLLGEGKKFVVLKGSKTASVEKAANSFKEISAATNLERLKKQGVLQEVDGYYQFNEAHIFNSPSGASDLIYLGATNGWKEWKNKEGESLEKLRE
ncbi:GIY-YIG nuclease family protein [Turicibacter bilis]|uniref:GIY-YIG nuclease family protein n=1 Tax=Turicibacter bilis TaxID=2735723 RepID=UPI001BAEA048|nr:GIY-YIG nuclease family protein [Turicibacter bilis]MBS3203431.1 GIY-YIG nuclease family protein [Turicibacter bilis]UUF10755.1 GIY-YIG nuclease family protein [Turicibacter bilis]